jgi:hypothetical protein
MVHLFLFDCPIDWTRALLRSVLPYGLNDWATGTTVIRRGTQKELPSVAVRPSKRVGFVVAGLVLVVGLWLVVGAVAFFTIFSVPQPARDVGEAFMNAVRDGSYSDAEAVASDNFQVCPPIRFGCVPGRTGGLQRLVADYGAQPSQWAFSSWSVSGNDASMEGAATFVDASQGSVRLDLVKEGETWKVDRFSWMR